MNALVSLQRQSLSHFEYDSVGAAEIKELHYLLARAIGQQFVLLHPITLHLLLASDEFYFGRSTPMHSLCPQDAWFLQWFANESHSAVDSGTVPVAATRSVMWVSGLARSSPGYL